MMTEKPSSITAIDHSTAATDRGVTVSGQQNVVITGHVGGSVTVAIGGRAVRAEELAYLDGLIDKYRYWAKKYTPLAGIAEVRAVVTEGPRLDLPMLFMPIGFEKLEEYGFGTARRIERVPVDDLRDAISKHNRLVLLGEPGSGKTTTLWRLAYDLAVAARGDPRAPLPVLVPLGGYVGPESALAFAQGYFEELGAFLPAYLRSRRVVLLLDALNEMPQTGYKKRVERVKTLLDQNPDVSVVVSCRALDYVETLRLEKLDIKPLDPERQLDYLQRYLGQNDGEKLFWQMAGPTVGDLWRIWRQAGGTWRQFWTADDIPDGVRLNRWSMDADQWRILRKNALPSLLFLGRNPFMLTMIAQVYAAGMGTLPSNRGRLFAAFVDTLLSREEMRCDPGLWLGADTLRRSMASLAFAMQRAGHPGTAVDMKWAAKQMAQLDIDASRAFYLCASATLLETTKSQVRFVHQLVQEYFAALALADRLHENDNLGSYWLKDWTQISGWEETFILLAGVLPDINELIERLLSVNPPLAARCIAEGGGERPDEVITQRVREELVLVVTSQQAPTAQRNAAGISLNAIGDPRPGVGLRPNGLPDIQWVFVPNADLGSGRKKLLSGVRTRRTKPDFWIALYPTTYLQFQAFLDTTDGYENDCWWQGLTDPPGHRNKPGQQRFPYWNHPRENVSWFDAMAFCRWLTAKAVEHHELLPAEVDRNSDWKITLPTEWQWEKAARGYDSRRYPWGEKYEEGRANINETYSGYRVGPNNLQKTSTVGMYPHIKPCDSPYGVADLTGNVWEWCLNEYRNPDNTDDGGDDVRAWRGGSWLNIYCDVAANFRFRNFPSSRYDRLGFRLVVVGRATNV